MCARTYTWYWNVPGVVSLAMYLSLALSGCTARHSASATEREARKASASAGEPSEHYFDGGTYCVQKFTQGPAPAQPLHFSNKVSESDGSGKDFEADLAGDTLDQTIDEQHPATDEDRKLIQDSKGGSVWAIHDGLAEMKISNHYNRSGESGWRVGANGATLGTAPWGLFIFKPSESRIGSETVNGFETIKYSIDTTHESQIDKAAGLLRQLKDYNIMGTAWVLKDANCVLQYQIDDEQIAMNGKVNKAHYVGTVMRR
jgi:hypothetical protein